MKVNLSHDSIDEIVVADLLENYKAVMFCNQGKVHPEDALYYIEILDCLERVICHYRNNGEELIANAVREFEDKRLSRIAKFKLGNMGQ